jgi:flagellar L-ring protein precursor FlgH
MKQNLLTLIILPTIISLSACGTLMDRMDNIGKVPKMERTKLPMKQPNYRPIKWPKSMEEPTPKTTNSNSLWQQGNRTFFSDKRARRIGDIVKVVIEINDKAELDNETERSRDGSNELDASSVFGLEKMITGWLPGKANNASLLKTESKGSYKGSGTVEREEKINTEVAAMITQILPNGNLVIQGSQEVNVNYEVRRIAISGIIRPSDIGSNNSIHSNLIAESRIQYGGRGQVFDVQQPRMLDQIVDIVAPF